MNRLDQHARRRIGQALQGLLNPGATDFFCLGGSRNRVRQLRNVFASISGRFAKDLFHSFIQMRQLMAQPNDIAIGQYRQTGEGHAHADKQSQLTQAASHVSLDVDADGKDDVGQEDREEQGAQDRR